MNRRLAMQALGGLVALPAQAWKPELLSEHQDRTVDVLSEIILPRTDTPGAHDAQVNRFIDRTLKDGMLAEERDKFLRGLEWLDAHCRSKYKRAFVELAAAEQTALLTRWSAKTGPADEQSGRDFFRAIKDLTLRGYYTSREGLLQELEYKGNGAFTEYPGCTHPEHKK